MTNKRSLRVPTPDADIYYDILFEIKSLLKIKNFKNVSID